MIIKGVFFDFFGTLVLPKDMNLKWSGWYPSVYSLYKENQIDIPRDVFISICNAFWSNIYDDKGKGITPFEKRLTSQCEVHKIAVTTAQIKNLARDVSEAWFTEHHLDEEAVDTLEYFKNKMKIALITNFDHPPYIKIMLERYKIIHYFDSVVISGEVGIKKPMSDIFLPALKDTGLKNSDIIYVGDSIMDFRAALHAGVIPVIIRRDGQYTLQNSANPETIYDKTDRSLHEFSAAGQIDMISKLSEIKEVVNKILLKG